MSGRIAKFLTLGLLLIIAGGWLALRVVGWPLWDGRSSYTAVPNWPRLPDGVKLGQVSGIDIDSQGRVFVFARGEKVWDSEPIDPAVIATPTVFSFDEQIGELLGAWGENRFVMPHGLTIDNEDNIWLTDVGLHQVFKFDREGKLLLTLGEAAVPGNDANHFNRPTDVAIAANGSFYVSDGYENSRVVKFDTDGRYLFEWGDPGNGKDEFDLPHSLAATADHVYVADRGNGRVQIFDGSGQFLTSWQDSWRIGRPWAVRTGDNGFVYIVDGGDQNLWLPDRARILKLTPDGEIVAHFGGYGRQPGQFIWPHALAVGDDGALYVAEVGGGQRIQKLMP